MEEIQIRHLSEEHRRKLSIALLDNRCALGCHRTEEYKRKQSQIQKAKGLVGKKAYRYGKKHTSEALEKMRKPRSQQFRETMRLVALNRPSMSQEARAKINRNRRGVPRTEETKAKIRVGNLGKQRSEEQKARMRGKRAPFTEEAKTNMSEARKLQWQDSKYRNGAIQSIRLRWQNPEYKDRVIRLQRLGRQIKPNKLELQLQAILDELCPGKWAFVGDGQLIIGGKNPDFMNVNGTKEVIELFGDFWHQGEDPQDRINHFRQYGFRCLVIWESELNQLKELLNKIDNFFKAGIHSREEE